MVDRDLLEAAVALRSVDYALWERFVTAMRNHSARQTASMLSCVLETLPRAQGMAIAANEIYTALRDAHTILDKDHARRSHERPAAPGPVS